MYRFVSRINQREMIKRISPVIHSEYPELTKIWEASVRATHHFLSECDLLYYKENISLYFTAVSLYAIRDAKNTIQGFLGTSDEAIEMLFIDPKYRGQGIGKELLHFALQKLHLSKVDVNEQNDQAVGFYLHLGFEIENRSELDDSGKPYPILRLKFPSKL